MVGILSSFSSNFAGKRHFGSVRKTEIYQPQITVLSLVSLIHDKVETFLLAYF